MTRALEVRDDIFLDRKITPLKELQRTASITYMGAVKGFEGLEETLSAPKLSSDLGKTELAQQVNSIPSSLLDKEFQKRRDFLAALSLTTALEVFFQDSDRQLLAQALASHSMKDLWDKMVAWMSTKYQLRFHVLKCGKVDLVQMESLLRATPFWPGLFPKEQVAKIIEEARLLNKSLKELLQLSGPPVAKARRVDVGKRKSFPYGTGSPLAQGRKSSTSVTGKGQAFRKPRQAASATTPASSLGPRKPIQM